MQTILIGTWAQPAFQINGSQLIDMAQKWADRGVTHMITGDPEPRWTGNTIDRYANWLKEHGGLKWMAYARKGFETYVNYDNFAGYVMPDEPDLDNHILTYPDGTFAVDLSIEHYVRSANIIRNKVPNYPILGNFAGPTFTASRPTATDKQHVSQEHYAKWFSALDITSCDWYLANTGRNVSGYLRNTLGEQINRMTTLSGGKPAFACIECSNQNMSSQSREPTPVEFAAMIMISIIRGAKGIWYFPQKIGGFSYDIMSQALSDYMTLFNKMLLSYSNFFIKGTRNFTSDAISETATWDYNNKRLTITLNCTGSPQTIGLKLYQPLEYSLECVEVSQNGLKASYFNNADLQGPPLIERIDPVIDFNFTPSVISPLNTGEFSIRWEGFIVPKYTEEYTLTTFSDDGVRVWLDGQQIINRWSRFRGETSAKIQLEAGKKYAIKIDYFQKWSGANMVLSWQSPSQPKEIVPTSQLFIS